MNQKKAKRLRRQALDEAGPTRTVFQNVKRFLSVARDDGKIYADGQISVNHVKHTGQKKRYKELKRGA